MPAQMACGGREPAQERGGGGAPAAGGRTEAEAPSMRRVSSGIRAPAPGRLQDLRGHLSQGQEGLPCLPLEAPRAQPDRAPGAPPGGQERRRGPGERPGSGQARGRQRATDGGIADSPGSARPPTPPRPAPAAHARAEPLCPPGLPADPVPHGHRPGLVRAQGHVRQEGHVDDPQGPGETQPLARAGPVPAAGSSPCGARAGLTQGVFPQLEQEAGKALWFLRQCTTLFKSPQAPIRYAAVWFAGTAFPILGAALALSWGLGHESQEGGGGLCPAAAPSPAGSSRRVGGPASAGRAAELPGVTGFGVHLPEEARREARRLVGPPHVAPRSRAGATPPQPDLLRTGGRVQPCSWWPHQCGDRRQAEGGTWGPGERRGDPVQPASPGAPQGH